MRWLCWGYWEASRCPGWQPGWTAIASEVCCTSLSASIQLGRTHAVAYQRPVTLCPSTDGRHCGSDWGEGWLLAEDGGERLLVGRALAKKERLRWNRSNHLRFLPSGQLNIHNGRFLLCGRHTVAWQLILNRQGRLRTASARENREKRELCSTSG